MGSLARFILLILVLFVADYCLALPAGDASTAGANAAFYNLWAAQQLSKKDSKTAKMMMMMQMMQANANMMASQENKKNNDKQEKKEKEETKKSEEIAKLEIPEFKVPQASPDEKVDLADLTYKPTSGKLNLPPMDVLPKEAGLAVVSQFKIPETIPSPSPSAAPAPVAPKTDPGPSAIGKKIDLPEKLPPGEEGSKLGFSAEAKPVPNGFNGPILAAVGPMPSPNPVVNTADELVTIERGVRKDRATTKEEVGGSDGGGGPPNREPSGLESALADLFGFKVPSVHEDEAELEAPEKESDAGANIFEYASYRFRKLGMRGNAGRFF